MPHKEIEQSDIDLETLIDLFDTALSSDNPSVKKALKNLLLVSSLVNSEIPEISRVQGPLKKLFDDVQTLNSKLEILKTEVMTIQHNLTILGNQRDNSQIFYTSNRTSNVIDHNDPFYGMSSTKVDFELGNKYNIINPNDSKSRDQT